MSHNERSNLYNLPKTGIWSCIQIDKPNSLGFNVLFSFIVLRELLFYSASNPAGLAANEAGVSSMDIVLNLTQVSVI